MRREHPEGIIKWARAFKAFMNGGDERLDDELVFSQVRPADQDVYEPDDYELEWVEHEQEERREVVERLERWRALKGYRAARYPFRARQRSRRSMTSCFSSCSCSAHSCS